VSQAEECGRCQQSLKQRYVSKGHASLASPRSIETKRAGQEPMFQTLETHRHSTSGQSLIPLLPAPNAVIIQPLHENDPEDQYFYSVIYCFRAVECFRASSALRLEFIVFQKPKFFVSCRHLITVASRSSIEHVQAQLMPVRGDL
jgi:hypothetical protein